MPHADANGVQRTERSKLQGGNGDPGTYRLLGLGLTGREGTEDVKLLHLSRAQLQVSGKVGA